MKTLETISEWIIKKSFKLSVWLIKRFSNMEAFDERLQQLRLLPKGTLGKEIADCLDQHHLRLVPHYESHDLKHSLLGYQMTPVDEIRLQAFMIGNGNISIPSIAIFTFGFILLPTKWVQFFKDFKTGLNSKPIKNWTIEAYADRNLEQLRAEVIMTDKKRIAPNSFLKPIVYSESLLSMLAGVIGMLYCLPFLFSSVLEDLVGAGFPFVAGAILFFAGLISLSIQTKHINTGSSNTNPL